MMKLNLILFFVFLHTIAFANHNENRNFRLVFTVSYIPLLGFETPSSKLEFEEDDVSDDIKNGSGFHLNFGLEQLDPFDSELMTLGWHIDYTHTEHKTRSGDYEIEFDQWHLEGSSYMYLYDNEIIFIKHQISLGVGFVLADYNIDIDSFAFGSFHARYMLSFGFYEHVSLQFGGGFFIWADFGEDQAYGGFFQISLNAAF